MSIASKTIKSFLVAGALSVTLAQAVGETKHGIIMVDTPDRSQKTGPPLSQGEWGIVRMVIEKPELIRLLR